MRKMLASLGVALAFALALTAAYQMEAGLDYFNDAGPAIDALVRGDLQGFLANQPLMGSFSLLVRAPFVAAVFDSDESVVYLAGAIPCLASLVLLGLRLSRSMERNGRSPWIRAAAIGLCVLNPLTFKALHWGHPEELLTAALCVAALLLACEQRALGAGILLGLAVATKQWAVLAVAPALIAVQGGRLRLAASAALVAAALTLPLAVGNPARFLRVATAAGSAQPGQVLALTTTPRAERLPVTPWNAWWPLATPASAPGGRGTAYYAPAWIASISHPLIVLAALPLALLFLRRRGAVAQDAILLAALLFWARCVFDPIDLDYYHVPLLLCLLAWEVQARPGLPALSLVVSGLLSLSFLPHLDNLYQASEGAPVANAAYLAWMLPFGAWMCLRLYAPEVEARLVSGVRTTLSERGGGTRGDSALT